MGGDQLLIGGDDALAGGESAAGEFVGESGAADGFHDDGNLGVGLDDFKVVDDQGFPGSTGEIAQVKDILQFDFLPAALGDGGSVHFQYFGDTGTDGDTGTNGNTGTDSITNTGSGP